MEPHIQRENDKGLKGNAIAHTVDEFLLSPNFTFQTSNNQTDTAGVRYEVQLNLQIKQLSTD